MINQKLAFIGSGQMAQSIISGLVNNNFPAENIWATGTNTSKLAKLANTYNINTTTDNATATQQADIIILATAPDIIKTIADEINAKIRNKNPIIISLAASISFNELKQWFAPNNKIIRAMPNTPTAVNAGVTAFFTSNTTPSDTLITAKTLFQQVGTTVQLPSEEQFDIVTILSGCGPAYFYLVMEALQNTAIGMGLDSDTARNLTVQTAFGAAKMATLHQQSLSLSQLRQNVSPPGGITEQAILSLENDNLRKTFATALQTAKQKLSQ